ncbi:MAG TPA: polyamine aminopropyltransferase [Xanthobacteraceae bacterium]|nr:polyamine aminopropyltransferase [Xanthobacteraceae bacterium]
MTERRWISEVAFKSARQSFEVARVLHEEKTEQHHLELIENDLLGKILLLDGAVQVTTADEFVYHEMLSHVPILSHGNVRDAMIIGGGDCGLAEEVLKHKNIENLLQVEIDASVVEFSKEHFSEFNAPVFTDPRFTLQIADGAAFVAETDRRFDVIMVDSTDPTGPGVVLFTEEFYKNLRRCLRPGGIVVTQSSVPFVQPNDFRMSMRNLSRAFDGKTTCYVASIPTYYGGHMALGFASMDVDPRKLSLDVVTERFGDLDTRYYTPEVHLAAFALPRFIAQGLAEAKSGA